MKTRNLFDFLKKKKLNAGDTMKKKIFLLNIALNRALIQNEDIAKRGTKHKQGSPI